MAKQEKNLFLARESYKRRRIIDASRLLPIFGLFLFLVPLLWDDIGSGTEARLAEKTLYVFAIWFILVALGAGLAVWLRPSDLNTPRRQDDESGELRDS